MQSILSDLKSKYPQFNFKVGDQFYWSPSSSTIFYVDTKSQEAPALLLHELAHALLGHKNYTKDIELLNMESDAWQKTLLLAVDHQVMISEEDIEDSLDSYRDWLHARSLCPTCGAVGHQGKDKIYHCVVCNEQWRTNEARTCQLRRYKHKGPRQLP